MSPTGALKLTGLGVALLIAGLTWKFGAWALIGCGAALTALGLLIPQKERRGEPSDEPAAPRA